MSNATRRVIRMWSCVPALILGLAIGAVPGSAATDAGDMILLSDDFEAYPGGTFPWDWELVWSGAGPEYQTVMSGPAASGGQSFQLRGTPYWSAVAQRFLASDSPTIGYEFKIMIRAVATRGEDHPGFFRYQAEGNQWGTYYASVRFDHASRTIRAEDGTLLGGWSPAVWYDVRVVLDRKARTYRVWINGSQAGGDLRILGQAPELIDAIALVAGHDGMPVYYDDVVVFVPSVDSDGDGVPDDLDNCPTVNPGLIDINVDGCIDTCPVIADHLAMNLAPLAPALPGAAVVELNVAAANLQTCAFQVSVQSLLDAVEVLEGEGSAVAMEAELLAGATAQTATLLAIDQATQVLGPTHPRVITAKEAAQVGIDLLRQLQIPAAIQQFLDAIGNLLEPARPAIKVEVQNRAGSKWETYTTTYAAVGEKVHYGFRVTNVGNVDLTDVRAYQMFGEFRKDIGGLAVGEVVHLNFDELVHYEVQYNDPDPFHQMSTAVGQYKGRWVMSSAISEVDVIHPQISIKLNAPGEARIGQLIWLDFVVVNSGDVRLYDVLFYVSRGPRFYDRIGDMPPGMIRRYRLPYVIPRTDRDYIFIDYDALGGRDYDLGVDWTYFPRVSSLSPLYKIRIIRP